MTVITETLLDKLYNLRGEDSTILKEMNAQKQKAEETKKQTTEQKGILQNEIQDLKKLKEELEEQGEKFKNLLQGIDREDYSTVLARLKIDFDPEGLLERLNKNLPKTIENVEKDTQKSEEELVKVEDEMNRAITTIEELGIRKDTALANQEKLNEYIDLALSGRINITRDSITSLLEEFHFNEEEQREAAKILMFPEDALYAYDEKIKAKDKSGKSISEVIQEAKHISFEEKTKEPEEEPIFNDNNEISAEPSMEDMINILQQLGIDYLDFSSKEVNKLFDNFDSEVIKENVNYITSLNIDKNIFNNHIELLYDKELQDKITILKNIGNEIKDIYLNPTVLTKYNKEQLNEAIELLNSNGLDPKSVPLMAY